MTRPTAKPARPLPNTNHSSIALHQSRERSAHSAGQPSRTQLHEAVEYDLHYIENRGIFLDFAILLHTLFFSMKGL
jgi:lipopolysaccharide/colanic/teichoic acid biosynthesis glycosyltransferase